MNSSTQKNRAGLLAMITGKGSAWHAVEGFRIGGKYYSHEAPDVGSVADVFLSVPPTAKDTADMGALFLWDADRIKTAINFVKA